MVDATNDDMDYVVVKAGRRRVAVYVLAALVLAVVIAVGYLALRFLPDEPVAYADDAQHFKYGSTGGERNWGFPYWIWRAAPKLCTDLIPGARPGDVGYEAFGMVYEPGKDLPVGVSKRRHLGLDRVFLNCAACHISTVRRSADEAPQLVLGMPANTFNILEFQKFFFACAQDQRFNWKALVPQIQAMGGDLDVIDRYAVYPLAIWLTRDLVALLESRFAFIERQPPWGPGRVDTFNSAKAKFNFPWDRMPDSELIGTTDFPAIWNQRLRKTRGDGERMELHWDGNNDKVEERNLSAAFGTGAIPPVTDHAAIARLERWLLDLAPPAFPFEIDAALAARGEPLYRRHCAECHGASGSDFSGKYLGTIVPIDAIGTDPWRMNSYTYELAVNQATLYAGYEERRFRRFRKTYGYSSMPLDGLWVRAPYLHNGSVPTLRDLLEPAAQRPTLFYRGNDLYEPSRMGFVSNVADEGGRRYFRFDTSVPGNSNQGHEGAAYGTTLAPDEKDAIVEYLKTF